MASFAGSLTTKKTCKTAVLLAGLSVSNQAVYTACGQAQTHRFFDTFAQIFVADRSGDLGGCA
jgi:hypothetical protein